jgi:hypothetical protein
MNRRSFLCSTGITALGSLLPDLAFAAGLPSEASGHEPFEWSTPELTFAYELSGQMLRQKYLLPSPALQEKIAPILSSGVETAIQWFRKSGSPSDL